MYQYYRSIVGLSPPVFVHSLSEQVIHNPKTPIIYSIGKIQFLTHHIPTYLPYLPSEPVIELTTALHNSSFIRAIKKKKPKCI